MRMRSYVEREEGAMESVEKGGSEGKGE